MSPSPPLLSCSLKVQHSQASPNRCCQLSSAVSGSGISNAATASDSDKIDSINLDKSSNATISSTSSTVTGESRNLKEYNKTTLINNETNEINQNLDKISIPSTSASTTRLLVNGTCSESESDNDSKNTNATTTTKTTTVTSSASPATTITTVTTSSNKKKSTFNHRKRISNHLPCTCKCTPADFSNATLSPDELKQETCKILDDVSQLKTFQNQSSINSRIIEENPHKNCKCICKDKKNENQNDHDTKSEDELSLVLIGLAQFNPAVKFVNSEAFVPTISVVPPTPEPILSKTVTNIWDNTTSTTTTTKLTINNIPGQAIIENIPEDSPDESPQEEEPPYRSLNTKLRRYGTMSSLEKLPLDDVCGTNNEHSSEDGEDGEEDEEDDEDDKETVGDDNEEEDDDDIEVITRQIFTGNENNQASLRNWTARAGSYVVEKMSFFEESRAFIDKYLGRWNQDQNEYGERIGGDEEQMEECTSGATSGEEVWGTPTSGGDNEDTQIGSSEHTQSV